MNARRLLLLIFTILLLLPGGVQAADQPFVREAPALESSWHPTPLPVPLLEASPRLAEAADRVSAFALDTAGLDARLALAPQAMAHVDLDRLPLVALPRPDGTLARYRVEESPVLEPSLQERFPMIRTYVLTGEDGSVGRATRTPRGFDALLVADGRTLRVAPLAETAQPASATSGRVVHLAYEEADLLDTAALTCGVTGETLAGGGLPGVDVPVPELASGTTLRTYRLAVATTGEFYAVRGGTDASVLAAITTDINRVNLLYGMELAINFTIIGATTDVFYTDGTTDPYTDGTPCTMRSEAAADIPAVIGAANFDIGHVIGAVAAGGCAGGSNVCTNQKANGATTLRTDAMHPAGHEDFGGYRLLMHEIGHQFGAGHSWNAPNTGNCTAGQYAAGSAVEPDSGTTVMSYFGTCGTSDIGGGPADPYFHTFSHDQIVTFSTMGSGNTCPTLMASGNAIPVVNAGPDYTIPRGTPFTLTGSATDADGDALTFNWEQVDLAAARQPPNTDDGASPLFRSFPPSADGNVRTFPQWSDILNNTQTIGETLPTTDRTLTFTLSARDNRPVGGVNQDTMVLTTDGSSFRVIEPGAGDVLQAGCSVEVDWILGSAADHADEVRILYSTDGGATFPTELAQVDIESNPVEVTLPCEPTSDGRILVEAVDNVFFNVSLGAFEVVAQPPSIGMVVVGGPVDDSCSREVTFEGLVVDDCGVLAADVNVSASLAFGVATVGAPSFVLDQVDSKTVSVTGTVLVSDLVGCPAEVEIEITGIDGCGLASAFQQSADVTDETSPQLQGVPADQVVECDAVPPQAIVTAVDACDGSPEVVPSEEEIPGPCPGEYTLVRTWSSTDECGNVAEASQVVEVVDTTPPTVTPVADDVACLWPPNHRMTCFAAADFAPEITDNCSEPVTWRFVGCASDQPDDGLGDGSTEGDCEISDDGQAFCVRAERSGLEPAGRRYAVTIEATDACGNVSEPVVVGNVHVPHSGGCAAGE